MMDFVAVVGMLEFEISETPSIKLLAYTKESQPLKLPLSAW